MANPVTGPAARHHVRNLLQDMGFTFRLSTCHTGDGTAAPHLVLSLHGTPLYAGDWWQEWTDQDRAAEPAE